MHCCQKKFRPDSSIATRHSLLGSSQLWPDCEFGVKFCASTTNVDDGLEAAFRCDQPQRPQWAVSKLDSATKVLDPLPRSPSGHRNQNKPNSRTLHLNRLLPSFDRGPTNFQFVRVSFNSVEFHAVAFQLYLCHGMQEVRGSTPLGSTKSPALI